MQLFPNEVLQQATKGVDGGVGGFQDASMQGQGGATVSLVQGKVAALAAIVDTNNPRIRSVTCK